MYSAGRACCPLSILMVISRSLSRTATRADLVASVSFGSLAMTKLLKLYVFQLAQILIVKANSE